MTTVVVLAAHGSRAPAANDAHREVARAVDARVAARVVPAFLELADPSIGGAIDRAVAEGAATVLVLPYFLHPGRHLVEDIPGIVGEASRRHPDRRVELLEPFGADQRLVAILAEMVEGATG